MSMNMKTILFLLIIFYTLITFSDAEKAKIDPKVIGKTMQLISSCSGSLDFLKLPFNGDFHAGRKNVTANGRANGMTIHIPGAQVMPQFPKLQDY